MAFLDCTTNMNYVGKAGLDEMAGPRERGVQSEVFCCIVASLVYNPAHLLQTGEPQMYLSGNLPWRWAVFVSVLCVSLFLSACGAVVGGNSPGPGLPPQFTSTPGTAASQGSAYTYQIVLTTATSAATLTLVTAPSGATLTGNTLTWTPSAAQPRTSNQFSITATNAAGNATQSWTVIPSGTVTVSWVNTDWTPNGTSMVPNKIPLAQVWVPQPDGSFLPVPGAENPDGSFSIPNVPGGYYWLEVGRFFYWTSNSTFDLGMDVNTAATFPPTVSPSSTHLIFNFAGLDPLQAQDELGFFWFLSPPFTLDFDGSSPAGATSLTTGILISTNIDFSQSGAAFLLQYEPETIGTLSALALGPAVTLPSFALTNGTSNTISGTLAPSPRNSFDLNVKGSAWTPLFAGAGPGTITQEGADLEVAAQAYMTDPHVLSTFGPSIPLVAGPRASALSPLELPSAPACFVSGPANPALSAAGPPYPPLTSDQDFGTVQYGDPFASSWLRVFTFCQTALVPLAIPGSTTPVSFRIVDKQSSGLPASQISPLIGQVQNPTINGMNLFQPATVAAKSITLSWSAPAGTAPTGYKVESYFPVSLNGASAYVPGPLFYTAKTSCSLPFVQPGQTYVFVITAVLDGAANFESQPNRSALPTAAVSVVSAPILIGN